MFSFKRRINRVTFFAGNFIALAMALIAVILLTVVDESELPSGLTTTLITGLIVFLVGVVVYFIILAKQRSNDISGDNAWIYLILTVLALGWLLGVIPGEKRKNQYGPIPHKGISLG